MTNNEDVYPVAGVMRCEPGLRIAEYDFDLQPVEFGVMRTWPAWRAHAAH